MVAPADVDSGLNCGCTCVGCGARLIAKKGPKLAWHFAHHVVLATQSCVESAIHAAAKQVLLENNWLQVPQMVVTVTRHAKFGDSVSKSRTLGRARTIRFDYSRDEVWEAQFSLRPDVVGYRGSRRLLVEMCFRHEVDEVKRSKLASLGLPTLEIDLSDLAIDASFAAVRARVLEDESHKEWLFYPGQADAKAELSEEVRKEVEALNRENEATLAANRRREEAQRREEERVRQSISNANEQFRLLPTAEKVRLVREKLGIEGAWPYFLNKPSPESSAIGEPARVWQAALFARFVLGKAGSSSFLELDTLVKWVAGRFGVVDNRSAEVTTAVRKFLAYLTACRFLRKSPYDPYDGTPYYEVIHGGPKPPPKPSEQHSKGKPYWHWLPSWPSRHDMLETSEKLLSDSPHREELATIPRTLTQTNCPAYPTTLAYRLEAKGVPVGRTLDYLVAMGLALQGHTGVKRG